MLPVTRAKRRTFGNEKRLRNVEVLEQLWPTIGGPRGNVDGFYRRILTLMAILFRANLPAGARVVVRRLPNEPEQTWQ